MEARRACPQSTSFASFDADGRKLTGPLATALALLLATLTTKQTGCCGNAAATVGVAPRSTASQIELRAPRRTTTLGASLRGVLRGIGFAHDAPEKRRSVPLAISTVAIVAIAAVIVVALIAVMYIAPRGRRRS